MSTADHVLALREKISGWLNKSDDKTENKVQMEDLKVFAELLGFSAKVDAKTLVISTTEQDNATELNDAKVLPESSDINKLKETKEAMSPKPANEVEINVSMTNVPTSSPIIQPNKISDTLMKIINLAKDALDNDVNSTFIKTAYLHKRVSDIKVSPLAMNSSRNHLGNDLNVTKTKENTSTLKPTPKKKKGAVIVKPEESKVKKPSGSNVSITFKKNVLQPVQSNLQALKSKLRTPTQIRPPTSSLATRSAGAPPSRVSALTERRLSTTPLRKDPHSLSRLKYASSLKK
ncbi:uncharacterized protein [Atheta coriaria]|uniref:uncharacterized protein n=1 Tax=Dalotia coriaria TaxID=877792 RepID=UPI0031F411F0